MGSKKGVLGMVLSIFFLLALRSEAQEVIKLTFALFQPPTAALSKVNTEFAKEIERRTNGRVQITVFAGGSLLTGPAMLEGVKKGIADMGNWTNIYTPGVFPFTSILELPVRAESQWVASRAMYDFLQKYGERDWKDVIPLTVCGSGPSGQVIGTRKKPVRRLEDMKGLSFRTNNPDVVSALGATVKNLPMAEVYDAISKGVIDGIYANFEPMKSWRLAEVCKYITVNLGLPQNFDVWANIMNKKKWDSLPPDVQKVIREVADEFTGRLGSTWDDQCLEGLEYAKSVGCEIYVLPDDEAERWTKVIASIIGERMDKITAKGVSRAEVEEAWKYYQSRIEYWNAQQRQKGIVPLSVRIKEALQRK